jgi:hypothetical protein
MNGDVSRMMLPILPDFALWRWPAGKPCCRLLPDFACALAFLGERCEVAARGGRPRDAPTGGHGGCCRCCRFFARVALGGGEGGG